MPLNRTTTMTTTVKTITMSIRTMMTTELIIITDVNEDADWGNHDQDVHENDGADDSDHDEYSQDQDPIVCQSFSGMSVYKLGSCVPVCGFTISCSIDSHVSFEMQNEESFNSSSSDSTCPADSSLVVGILCNRRRGQMGCPRFVSSTINIFCQKTNFEVVPRYPVRREKTAQVLKYETN